MQNVREGNHLPVSHGGADLSCPVVKRCIPGKANQVTLRVVDGLAHDSAVQTVDEIKRKGRFSVIDRWRLLDTMHGERTFFATEKMLGSLTHLLSPTKTQRSLA